jgi:signal transduction histidine kinase
MTAGGMDRQLETPAGVSGGGTVLERTAELDTRPARTPDFESENKALRMLSAALGATPRAFLQQLVEVTLETLKVEAAAVCLLSHDGSGDTLEWLAHAGSWSAVPPRRTPKQGTANGAVLATGVVQLFAHPEREDVGLAAAGVPMAEALVAPLRASGQALGTLWAASRGRLFDSEDRRLLESLAVTAGGGLALLRLDAATDDQAAMREAQRLAHIGSWSWDAATNRITGSDELYRIFGLDRDHVAFPSFADQDGLLYPHDSWWHISEAGRRTFETGVACEVEVDALRHGTAIRVLARFEAVSDSGGRFVGMRGVVQDTTERFRSQELLRHTQVSLDSLLEHAPFGVYVVDSAFRIAQVNAGTRNGFGNVYPLIGRDFEEVVRSIRSAEYAASMIARFRHTLETGEPCCSREQLLYRADPENRSSYEWELHRLSLPDGEYGVVCFYFDSTELRAADQRKDEFLATLAHELRNPLAPIANSIAILDRVGSPMPVAREARGMIARQVQHLTRLIDDLLDVSRINRDKLELRREPVELASVVYAAVETCGPLVQGLHHELELDLPSEPIWLDADPVRLAQVLANVFNNACKYTPPPGYVWLTARREGEEAVIRIRDSGKGIPAEKLEEIFLLFSQIDGSLERQHGGLGIGLHLVKRFVEMHGGTVKAWSAGLGRGTEVTIRLPALPSVASEVTPEEPSGAVEDQQHRRVLVVDDNLDAAESLAMLLRLHGHATETAGDGLAAVEKAAEWLPDVILLDIGLPKMSGYDACRRIRQQPSGPAIYIIALTGWGQAEDRQRSTEAGFDDHLVKPIDFAALLALVDTLPVSPRS